MKNLQNIAFFLQLFYKQITNSSNPNLMKFGAASNSTKIISLLELNAIYNFSAPYLKFNAIKQKSLYVSLIKKDVSLNNFFRSNSAHNQFS